MSKYVPTPVYTIEEVYRELQRISVAISQQFDNEPVWEHVSFPSNQLEKNPATAKPDFDDLTALGNVKALRFDGASSETVYFTAKLPHAWQEGSIFHPYVQIVPTETTTNATTIWVLEYTTANESATFGTTISITSTVSISTAYFNIKHDMADITAADGKIGITIIGSITRLGATDTYTLDAGLLDFGFHYQRDSNGSVKPHNKSGS